MRGLHGRRVWMAVALLAACGGGGDGGGGGVQKGTFTDTRDGAVYAFTGFGSQVWMAENLRYKTGAGSWYWENDPANAAPQGVYYLWDTAMGGATSSDASPSGVRGVCPQGWHLPSQAEWQQLSDYLVAHALTADDLRAAPGPDTLAFSLVPTGTMYDDGAHSVLMGADRYTSTTSARAGVFTSAVIASALRFEANMGITNAYPVRCLRD